MFWHQDTIEREKSPDLPEDDPKTHLSEKLKSININELSDLDLNQFNLPYLDPDFLIGNESDVNDLLKQNVKRNNKQIENVANRIEYLYEQIESLRSYFFDDFTRRSKIKENRFYIPDNDEFDVNLFENNDTIYLTEVANSNQNQVEATTGHSRTSTRLQKLRRSGFSSNSDKKTLENYEYSHFEENELSDFPGYLEAAQLLNSLTAKMNFKQSFLKYWNPIIRSEASCAILLDAFWWFYLRYFCPEADPNNTESYKYFCRLAESFASLLYSIDVSIRDRFFEYYVDYLCQAVYWAFFQSFPDSRLQFNDQFKEELTNTIYEWILGVRPIKDSHEKWVINDETNSVSNKDFKVSSTNRILQKIENLEILLNELGEDMESENNKEVPKEVRFRDELVIYERPITSKSNRSRSSTPLKEFEKFLSEWYTKKGKESHVIGEGIVVEKYGFNPKGQSVLINQYRRMYSLQNSGGDTTHGFKVTRTEILKNPPRTAPTYRDFIYDTLRRSKSAGDEFKKKIDSSQEEIRRIETERKQVEAEYNRMRRSTNRRPSSKKTEK